VRRLGIVFLALVVACAVAASSAYASCIQLTAAQKRAQADVIFNGVALEGPTATGVQRFRVVRYLKGRGPDVVRVNTGYVRRADGTGSITSVSLVVRRGQRWRIFAEGAPRKVLRTNVCIGSRRL
jgi:hypothetical protein